MPFQKLLMLHVQYLLTLQDKPTLSSHETVHGEEQVGQTSPYVAFFTCFFIKNTNLFLK